METVKEVSLLVIGRCIYFLNLTKLMQFLVQGGAGFVGENILAAFNKLGFKTYCFDVVKPSETIQFFAESFVGDIRDDNVISDVIKTTSPTCIIHLASFGMSGSDMLSDKCYSINVLGTRNIIDACIEHNVRLLVYTSTYNVVFCGQPIFDGNECIPYYPQEFAADNYGPTKQQAEKIVIQFNDSLTADKGRLHTCSIRPAAIYGEHESRHFERIIRHIDR
jgi:nucleoside-diphosphate-sugar epimerase